MKKSNFNKNKGYVLLMALLTSAALMFFGLLYLDFFRTERILAQRVEYNLIAEAAADAGIDDAIAKIRQNYNWNGDNFPENNNVILAGTKASYNMVFCEPDLLNPSQPPPQPCSINNSDRDFAVTGYGGRRVPPYSVHLISIGEYHGSQRKKEVVVSTSISPSRYGIFANDSITLNGTVTIDSFDSSLGPYDILTKGSNGDISTNSISTNPNEAVSIVGTVDVNGNIFIGPGGDPLTAVSASGKGIEYNGVYNLQNTETFPVLIPPSVGLNPVPVNNGTPSPLGPGTYSSLTLNGNAELTLQSGTYVFTEDINIGANTTLIIPSTASVQIYAMKNVYIAGGALINESHNSSNFSIYGGENTTEVKIAGGPDTYLFLYAPKAKVTISGDAGIYGSIVSNTLTTQGTTAVHYDMGLKQNIISRHNGIAIVRSRW